MECYSSVEPLLTVKAELPPLPKDKGFFEAALDE